MHSGWGLSAPEAGEFGSDVAVAGEAPAQLLRSAVMELLAPTGDVGV